MMLFVGIPLLKDEIEVFNEVYKQHIELSIKEHNALLNSLLKGKNCSKIVCVIVSPKNNSTDQAAVVLLPPNKDLPTGDEIKCLSSKVSKMTYSSLQDGAIEISPGFTCQWIYSWPYKKVMTTSHLLALQQAYPNPRKKQLNTECCQGFYQNFEA